MAYATFRSVSGRLRHVPQTLTLSLSGATETSLWTNLTKAGGLFSHHMAGAGGKTLCSRCASTLSGLSKATRLSSISRIAQHGGRTFCVVRIGSRQIFRLYSTKGGSDVAANAVGKGVKKTAKTSQLPEFRRLLSLAKDEKWRLAGAITLLFVSSTVTLAVPFGIGRVIDIIYTPEEQGAMVPRLKTFCKILLGVFIVGAIANFGRVYLMQISGNRIVKKMREKLFGSIIKQDIAFFDKTKTGELINRLSTDTSLVGQSVTMNISDGLRSVTQALGGISMMVYMSPKLAMIALSIVPPIALVSRYYGRYVQKITRAVQDSLAASTQVADERLSNMRTVRAFVQEEREQNAYNQQIDQVLQLSYKEALARGIFWGTTGLSGNIVVLSVFYYGGLMMSESVITVGEMSSFLMYAAFVGISIGVDLKFPVVSHDLRHMTQAVASMAGVPEEGSDRQPKYTEKQKCFMRGLSTFYTELMRGLGASTRVWQLIDSQPSIPLTDGIIPDLPMKGNIEFRDLYFSYPQRPDTHIFNGLSLCVPQGSVTAIVGSSGSGKSTLAALLLRYYDPDSGEVCVDGTSTRALSPSWLRSNMGLVNQEPTLFSCSIADNIKYGALEPELVTEEEVTHAAQMANAYNFIKYFPQGFDTLVGERGVMLSGGQKQRIAIARAIIKNPKILLFDEATSALDAESEHLVQEALERVMAGRTVITIAHRLSTIKNADQIAVLDCGQVVELGSYEKLMTLPDGQFKKLVERQMLRNNIQTDVNSDTDAASL